MKHNKKMLEDLEGSNEEGSKLSEKLVSEQNEVWTWVKMCEHSSNQIRYNN